VKPAGPQARCNRLASLLAQNWNTRTAVELELRDRSPDTERCAALEARLTALLGEGERLEREMTAAAQALIAQAVA
jgi:hypothetical protein